MAPLEALVSLKVFSYETNKAMETAVWYIKQREPFYLYCISVRNKFNMNLNCLYSIQTQFTLSKYIRRCLAVTG